MVYSEAYIQFLIQFHGFRDFFECHEILEDHWKEKEKGERDKHWTGLIQLATALYHHRRENWRGAEKLLKSCFTILQSEREQITLLGIDINKLLLQIEKRLKEVQNYVPYEDFDLPITDTALINTCQKWCMDKNVTWMAKSDMNNPYLIHRHILRDRSVSTSRLNEKSKLKKQRQKFFEEVR